MEDHDCTQSDRGEEGAGRATAHGAERHDWHYRRRHLLRSQWPRAGPAKGMRSVEADVGIHRGVRMAGHPRLRRPGADYESSTRLHAELQCSAVDDDEGLSAGSRKMERASVSV